MVQRSLKWTKDATAQELHGMLNLLGEYFPISSTEGEVEIELVKSNQPDISKVTVKDKNHVVIEYSDKATLGRGLSSAMADLSTDEKNYFSVLGIMLDCSRNAVMTVEHFKKWLRHLCLMGYNMAMLYTEDTYQLPNEPYFGYLRGAYSMAELKEIDAYAKELGIEMIGCIQTLGHMEQFLKWTAAGEKYADTSRVMLVDSDDTYDLIDRMLGFWAEAFSSKRIHIGMDETHDLGRGKFMDKYGYERGFDIFNRHLNRVNELCRKHGLRGMIWSDMYFRMGSKTQDYYDLNAEVPPEVLKEIPTDVDLVYWDYYHADQPFYSNMLKIHEKWDRNIIMGSGIWMWSKYWHDFPTTKSTVGACVDACIERGTKEMIFTMWGDDGAFAEIDSGLSGISWAADVCFGNDKDNANLAKRFEAAIPGASFYPQQIAGEFDYFLVKEKMPFLAHMMLWDDPIMGICWNVYSLMDKEFDKKICAKYYDTLAKLEPYKDEKAAGDVSHAIKVHQAFLSRLQLHRKMLEAYEGGDMVTLQEIVNCDIPEAIKVYEELSDSFRTVWMKAFKVYGFEAIQMRNAAVICRYKELAKRLQDLIDQKVKNIPEFDEKPENIPESFGGRTLTSSYWF